MSITRATCCVIGDCEVGKTSIVKVFQNEGGISFPKNYHSTCGIDVLVKAVNIPDSSDIVELYLLDNSGKDLYMDIFKQLQSRNSMIAVVYDVTNEDSFNNCQKWLNHISGINNGEQQVPGVCIANKIDLSQRRIVTPKAGQEFAKMHKLQYFECSAKESKGVEAPFFYLANEWYKRHQDSVGL